jgi:hypothetical protein
VAGLDHPAAGTPPGRAQLELDLLAARADVRREAALTGELADPRVVVGAVEAQALRLLGCGLGPLDWDRVERRL